MAVGKIITTRGLDLMALQGLELKNNGIRPFNIGTNVEWVVSIIEKSYQLGGVLVAWVFFVLYINIFGLGYVVGKNNQNWAISIW